MGHTARRNGTLRMKQGAKWTLALILAAITGYGPWGVVNVDAQEESPPVYFNEDPVLLSRVRKFLEEEEKKNYADAIGTYREVASYVSSQSSSRPYLYQAEEGLYLPVEAFLRGRVIDFPREEIAAFQREADFQAKPQWEKILRRGDVGGLRDFLRRNPLSSLIPRTVEALAGFHVERGEFDEALGILGFLRRPEDWTPEARLLRDVALRASGRATPVEEATEEEPLRLGGDERSPEEILDELAGAVPLSGWRSFGGDPTHSRVPEPAFDPGRRIASAAVPEPEWGGTVLGPPGVPGRRRSGSEWGPSVRGGPLIPYFPVHDGRRVILSDTFTAHCVDLRDGSLLWSHSLRRDRSVPWGGPVAGHYPAASRDVVFVTLSPREAGEVSREGEGDQAVQKVAPGEGFRVMALEIATGEILWETSKRPDLRDDLSEAVFVSSPLLLGDRLYLLVTRLEEEASASVISLNALTGDKLWETHICTTFSPMILGRGIRGAYLAGASGRVYASTNLGAVASLDGATGGILWVRAYDRHPAPTQADLLLQGSEPPDEAPILVGGTTFAVPRDSPYLYALDSDTGRIHWRFERTDEDRLIGVRGDVVLLSGRGLLALHRVTGKVLWRVGLPPGGPAGRPALAGDLIYVPTATALFLHRISDGAEAGRLLWSHPGEEAGNIVFAGDRMITVSPLRVNVYEDRGDTLRALAALPEFRARLGEGELLLRRGNESEAVETLLTARRLAGDEDEIASVRRVLARAREILGRSAMERGDLVAAATSFEAAAEDLEGEARAQLFLETGGIYERLGSPKDALRLHRKIVLESAESTAMSRRFPSRSALAATARIRRRLEAGGRGEYEPYEAEAKRLLETASKFQNLNDYQKVVSSYPNSLAARRALLAIVGIYEGSQQWSLAAARLDNLLGRAPDSPPALYQRLARLYEQAGRRRRARRIYSRIAASSKPSPELDDARSRLEGWGADLPDISLQTDLLWRATSDSSLGRLGLLAPEPGAHPGLSDLFVVTGSTGVEVRDAPTGLLRWSRYGLSRQGRRRAVLQGDLLLLPDPAGILAVDLLTGDEVWKGPFTGEEEEAPPALIRVAAEGRHIVATATGDTVLVLDAVDGSILKSEKVPKLEMERAPVFSGGKVILSLRPAGVALLDPEGADPVLRYESRGAGDYLSQEPLVDPGGRVILLVGSRKVVSLDAHDLKVAWKVDHPWILKILLSPQGGPVILIPRPQDDPELRALDPSNGREVWSTPMEKDAANSPIAIGPDAVYLTFGGALRRIEARSIANGDLLWEWRGAGWGPSNLFVTRGYLVALVPDMAPPSRLLFLNRREGGEEPAIAVPVDRRASALLLDDVLVVAGDTGIFGYGQPEMEALRRDLVALEETPADPAALAALRFALGRKEEAVQGLADAILREDLSVEEFRRLFDQLEGYRMALAEAKPAEWGIPRLLEPPKIDGELGDWYSRADRIELEGPAHISPIRGLGPGPVPWRGEEDLSGRLYMGWDNENFYFLLDVNDTYLRPYVADKSEKEWKGDCLLIAIDPKNDGGYWNRGDDILVTLALQAPRKDEEEDEEEEHEPKGKYFVKRKDDNSGVVYEAAIPWEMFRDQGVRELDPEKGPDPGFRFGFNPVLTDDDGLGQARKVLSWTPGIRVHRMKGHLYNPGEIVPEYYGKIFLK